MSNSPTRFTPPWVLKTRADYNAKRNAINKTVYDSAWVKVRNEFREANPFCQSCMDNGMIVAGEHIHHIIPAKKDPTKRLDKTNLVNLCKSCHTKTHFTKKK